MDKQILLQFFDLVFKTRGNNIKCFEYVVTVTEREKPFLKTNIAVKHITTETNSSLSAPNLSAIKVFNAVL